MDVLTHALLTRKLVGRDSRTVLAGIGPDAPFYLIYLVWASTQKKGVHALTTNGWPNPPRWMETLHHAFHSLPIALAGAVLVRMLSGHWPSQGLKAWTLHILVDIPTHSRRRWEPHFLWPFSDFTVDGIPWADIALTGLGKILNV